MLFKHQEYRSRKVLGQKWRFSKPTRHHAITLLELLLVLAVGAAIATTTLRTYQNMINTERIAVVRHDIRHLFAALNHYYEATPCDIHGVFMGKLVPDIVNNLHLPARYLNDPPLIAAYYVTIVPHQLALTQRLSIMYTLQVQAQLSKRYSVEQVHWYEKVFHAAQWDPSQRMLTFTALPVSQITHYNDNSLWLGAENALHFRNRTTDTHNDVFQGAHNLCAR